MPKSAMTTSGDVREFLANIMLGIRDGKVATDKASVIVKAAQQINEGFYSEIKTKQVHKAAGETTYELGKLPIS